MRRVLERNIKLQFFHAHLSCRFCLLLAIIYFPASSFNMLILVYVFVLKIEESCH